MSRRIRSVEVQGNTLFTTSHGIAKSTSASADIMPAGMPKALDVSITIAAGTIFTTAGGLYRAYRTTWALKDANNNLIVGAPSGRALAIGTNSTNATLSIVIPPQITASHVYQVFATAVGLTSAVGDSMVQIYEANPTTSQITAGTISYEDKIPNEFRNFTTPLYTNADQEGAAMANTPPPMARDMCEFRGFVFYANYTDPHRMTMRLVSAANLVADTSTVTIAGVVYTAHASEVAAAGQFQIFTAAVDGDVANSASEAVDNTAKSLCRVINSYVANTAVYAYYQSTPDGMPGSILIEERAVGGSAFTAIANNAACGNCFVPPLPTSGSTYTSIAERRKNRIRVSKQGQGEHCPIARDLIVGSENDEIQRVIALNEMVIVIKDRSIWRITGGVFEDFIATIHDDTCSIAGRDSAAKLNNTIFMLSNQGFVAITSQGVQIVGRPIENSVLAGLDALDAPDHDQFVGIGVEVKRLYLCRGYDAATSNGVTYAYNAITRQWSRWLIDPQCLTVVDDRILYGLDNALGYVLQERNSRRDSESQFHDMSDELSTFQISSRDVPAKTITGTFTAGIDYTGSAYSGSIGYGWVLYDGTTHYLVTSANGSDLTLNDIAGLDDSTLLNAYRPISMTVEWNPITGGNPGELKQWGDITIRCETQNAYKVVLSYANEYDTKADPVSTTWVSQPTAIDAYISGDKTKPTSSNTDFPIELPPGDCNPNNMIVSKVAKDRSLGYQLQPKLYHSVADSHFSIKSLVVEARPMGSAKGHQ